MRWVEDQLGGWKANKVDGRPIRQVKYQSRGWKTNPEVENVAC